MYLVLLSIAAEVHVVGCVEVVMGSVPDVRIVGELIHVVGLLVVPLSVVIPSVVMGWLAIWVPLWLSQDLMLLGV